MHGIHRGKLIGGRYEVLYLLGSGGMGSVYAAHDTHLGRRVALKILRPDLAANGSFRQRFLREARIAAQINHPNVTCTYDIGNAEAGPYLVQEFLDGRTLDQAMPLSPERALQVALDVADALSYIHAQGYVHCDIKPHNIMLVKQDTERAILLDFGIARMQGVATTTVFATPHYIAPEQSQGALPTAASDLYALGILLYESLTGNVPFDGPTQHAIIYQHLHEPVPPLEIDSPYTPMLEAMIGTLTAKKPESRYPSAAMLRADLLAVLAGAKHLNITPAKTRLARSRYIMRRWMLGLPL